MSEPSVAGYLKGWAGTAKPENHPPMRKPTRRAGRSFGYLPVSTQGNQALNRAAPAMGAGRKDPSGPTSRSTKTKPQAGEKVRLASVHFRPSGKSPRANCEEFAPLIDQAARQHADLVVLGETLTYYGTGKTFAEIAEPVPGPSTEYFGTGQEAWPVHRCWPARAR